MNEAFQDLKERPGKQLYVRYQKLYLALN